MCFLYLWVCACEVFSLFDVMISRYLSSCLYFPPDFSVSIVGRHSCICTMQMPEASKKDLLSRKQTKPQPSSKAAQRKRRGKARDNSP